MKIYKSKKPTLIWILLLTAPFFVISLLIFNFSGQTKIEILYLAALLYVTVALLHHHQEKSLNLETIIEYVLIALLALVILQGFII